MGYFDLALNYTCNVDRAITPEGLFFGCFVVLATAMFFLVSAKVLPQWKYHYFAVMMGVLIFEMFTSPLWNNSGFGKFAYVYQDVTWVLTLGWSTLILGTVLLIDQVFHAWSHLRRFGLYMVAMSGLGFLGEVSVVNLGLRTYSDEVLATIHGPMVFNVPVEVFYYIPVFSALIIGFYKYWAFMLERAPAMPERRVRWGKSLFLATVAVFLFELMVEPMAVNTNLPSWSFVYKDISILMTGGWVLLIWLSTKLIDMRFPRMDLTKRFGLYMLVGGYLAVVLESLYVSYGFRSYGPSVVRDFVGLHTPLTNLPIEILFAMPMYMALMIGLMRYLEMISNKGFVRPAQKP